MTSRETSRVQGETGWDMVRSEVSGVVGVQAGSGTGKKGAVQTAWRESVSAQFHGGGTGENFSPASERQRLLLYAQRVIKVARSP